MICSERERRGGEPGYLYTACLSHERFTPSVDSDGSEAALTDPSILREL